MRPPALRPKVNARSGARERAKAVALQLEEPAVAKDRRQTRWQRCTWLASQDPLNLRSVWLVPYVPLAFLTLFGYLFPARERLGLSAEGLGKVLGVSGQSIYNWESGKARPRGDQLAKLSQLRKVGKRRVMAFLAQQAGTQG